MSILSTLRSALFPPIAILAGLGLLYFGHLESQKTQRLNDHGKVAEATVTSVKWKEKYGNARSYKLEIQFQTEANENVSATVDVSDAEGKRYRETDANKVQVRYLPEDTHTVRAAGQSGDTNFMYGFGAVMIVAGVVIFVSRRRSKGD